MELPKMNEKELRGLLWRCMTTLSLCQATEEEGQGIRNLIKDIRRSLKEKE